MICGQNFYSEITRKLEPSDVISVPSLVVRDSVDPYSSKQAANFMYTGRSELIKTVEAGLFALALMLLALAQSPSLRSNQPAASPNLQMAGFLAQ